MEKALRRSRKIRNILFWAFLLCGFAIFAVETCIPKYYQNNKRFEKIELLKKYNRMLEERAQNLAQEKRAILTDPFYNEVIARRELAMVKPGETEIRLRPAIAEAPSLPEVSPAPPGLTVRLLLLNRRLQQFLLCFAYVLIVVAFLFFNQEEYESPRLPRKVYG